MAMTEDKIRTEKRIFKKRRRKKKGSFEGFLCVQEIDQLHQAKSNKTRGCSKSKGQSSDQKRLKDDIDQSVPIGILKIVLASASRPAMSGVINEHSSTKKGRLSENVSDEKEKD